MSVLDGGFVTLVGCCDLGGVGNFPSFSLRFLFLSNRLCVSDLCGDFLLSDCLLAEEGGQLIVSVSASCNLAPVEAIVSVTGAVGNRNLLSLGYQSMENLSGFGVFNALNVDRLDGDVGGGAIQKNGEFDSVVDVRGLIDDCVAVEGGWGFHWESPGFVSEEKFDLQ